MPSNGYNPHISFAARKAMKLTDFDEQLLGGIYLSVVQCYASY
jgi:hypothetical protein